RGGPRAARRKALVTGHASAPGGAGPPVRAAAALGCRGAPFAATRERLNVIRSSQLAPGRSPSAGSALIVVVRAWACGRGTCPVEDRQVDRVRHQLVSGVAGMKHVRRVGFRPEAPRILWISRGGIEVEHRVEGAARANPG